MRSGSRLGWHRWVRSNCGGIFSKVSVLLNLLYKMTMKLTFEFLLGVTAGAAVGGVVVVLGGMNVYVCISIYILISIYIYTYLYVHIY